MVNICHFEPALMSAGEGQSVATSLMMMETNSDLPEQLNLVKQGAVTRSASSTTLSPTRQLR